MNQKKNRREQEKNQNTSPIMDHSETNMGKRYIKGPGEISIFIARIMMIMINIFIIKLCINELNDDSE